MWDMIGDIKGCVVGDIEGCVVGDIAGCVVGDIFRQDRRFLDMMEDIIGHVKRYRGTC